MIRVGVHGATGRMGKAVVEAVQQAPDMELAWAYGREVLGSWEADVVIDFSTPAGLERVLAQARGPVVSGTTGGTVPELPTVPLLHAANFSLGVALLSRLVEEASQALADFDAEVVEYHHIGKKDAPSGTALRLAEAIRRGRGAQLPLVHGRTGPRTPGEIGMHALRMGDVVGDHTVFLAGPGERLELRHVASSRAVFVQGAIQAARWMVGRPAGRYRIEQVLGL
ncbi:MAG TPA: 4-hydroxy-tetrahydrodipicolinate reductase [Myxococcota bacterium]|nr:4-hydroxy-tetrahydrodipicolinate reductase [Myxococcota bacterium]